MYTLFDMSGHFRKRQLYKGWRTPIGCQKVQVIFRKRATNCRALLRKMTSEDKASYRSSHPTVILHSDLKHLKYLQMLQRVAVCCSVLQCVAVCCSVLHYVAVCCSVLPLHSELQHLKYLQVLQCVAVCCSVLQCVAVCCSVL